MDDCDAVCRRALGWLQRERGIPVAELSLSKLFPSAEREGVAVVFDYLQWLSARGISPATEGKAQFPAVVCSCRDRLHVAAMQKGTCALEPWRTAFCQSPIIGQ